MAVLDIDIAKTMQSDNLNIAILRFIILQVNKSIVFNAMQCNLFIFGYFPDQSIVVISMNLSNILKLNAIVLAFEIFEFGARCRSRSY